MTERSDTPGEDYFDVVIIGGGVAGLSAAARFRQERPGWHIAVVEAQGRLGGRAWTKQVDGFPTGLDLGALWLHGVDGNPLTEPGANGSSASNAPIIPPTSRIKAAERNIWVAGPEERQASDCSDFKGSDLERQSWYERLRHACLSTKTMLNGSAQHSEHRIAGGVTLQTAVATGPMTDTERKRFKWLQLWLNKKMIHTEILAFLFF